MIDVPATLIVVGINAAMLASAWGDLRRQVFANRERSDDHRKLDAEINKDRHEENQTALKGIQADVKRINGTVAKHDERLDHHGNEIDRLREEK